jgi:3-deoxy-D-manno-octulosonic-acid transferase
VVVETDLWPNFLEETARRGVPVVLANARMSDRSFARYRRFRFLFRPLYRRLRRICAQSALDADRYVRLGVSRKIVKVTGNLKFDRPLPPVSAATAGDRTRWGPAGDVPVIVAGSTHEGEEAILATVLAHLHGLGVPARMLVAPRDPARGAAAAQCFRRAGFQPGRLSREDTAGGPVFIVDAVGLLEELYAVSSVSVVGGSFVAEGGHNPLEPAACAKPVIFGPDMRDFREAAERLTAAGGAWQVQDAGGLREGLWHLLRDPEAAAAMGARARRVLDENRGALSCHLETILSLLEYRDL